MQAVLGAKAQQQGLAAEQDHGQLGVGVLQGEIDMARSRGTEVGDFSLHPHVAVLLLHQFANLADELAHRPDAARGAQRFKAEVELGRR